MDLCWGGSRCRGQSRLPGSIDLMLRFARILVVAVIAGCGVVAVHAALDLGSEFLEFGFEGIADFALLCAGILLVSLSDRELFWAVPPRHERSKAHRGRHA